MTTLRTHCISTYFLDLLQLSLDVCYCFCNLLRFHRYWKRRYCSYVRTRHNARRSDDHQSHPDYSDMLRNDHSTRIMPFIKSFIRYLPSSNYRLLVVRVSTTVPLGYCVALYLLFPLSVETLITLRSELVILASIRPPGYLQLSPNWRCIFLRFCLQFLLF